jgi:pilus assembly protein Flp/PilA
MRARTRSRRRNEWGASAVEYALVATLIAVVIIGSVSLFGGATSGLFETTCQSFPNSSGC